MDAVSVKRWMTIEAVGVGLLAVLLHRLPRLRRLSPNLASPRRADGVILAGRSRSREAPAPSPGAGLVPAPSSPGPNHTVRATSQAGDSGRPTLRTRAVGRPDGRPNQPPASKTTSNVTVS